LDESQVIKLRVPAEAAYARLARVAGGSIASRLEFDEDEIAALRLAIDEVWSILLGTIDHEGTIELTFCADAEGLVVELEVERLDRRRPGRLRTAAAERVLDRSVDEHWVSPDRRRARLHKRMHATAR
jgi:anti-sigma regulatory factor (Ser/Thr protein kinase)